MQPEKLISKPSYQKDLVLKDFHSYIQVTGCCLSITVLNNTGLQVSFIQTLFVMDLELSPYLQLKKNRVNGQQTLEAGLLGIVSCSFPDLHHNNVQARAH